MLVGLAGWALVGCLPPSFDTGYDCSADRRCPPGQECIAGRCQLIGAPPSHDAGDDQPALPDRPAPDLDASVEPASDADAGPMLDLPLDAEGDGPADGGPVLPDAPRLTSWPCPDGGVVQQTVYEGQPGYTLCVSARLFDPVPCSGALVPEGRASGQTTCEAVGTDCFPFTDPTGQVLYVDSTANAITANGSVDKPYRTLGAAIDRINADSLVGTVIVLAPHIYQERVVLPDVDVTLLGHCPSFTIIEAPDTGPEPVIWSRPAAGLSPPPVHVLQNLTINGKVMRPGLVATGSSQLVLERVSVTLGAGFGVGLGNISTALTRVKIADAKATDTTRNVGQGLVITGGTVMVQNSTIDSNIGAAVQLVGSTGAQPPATLTLDDVVIRNTSADPQGGFGFGILAGAGSHIMATGLLVSASHSAGLHLFDGATAELTDLVVRETSTRNLPNAGGRGFGLVADGSDTSVVLERALLDANHSSGLMVFDGASVTATDLVVRDTAASQSGKDGYGLTVENSATLIVKGGVLLRNRLAGVLGADLANSTAAPAMVSLDDVVITTTLTAGADQQGHGLVMRTGAAAILRRVILRDNDASGLLGVGGTITGLSVLHDCNGLAQPVYQADGAILNPPTLDEESRCGCQPDIGACRPTTVSRVPPDRLSDPASVPFRPVFPSPPPPP